MYAALARRIYSANNSQEVADIIKEIKQKLSERVPSDSEFVALFPELLYTNTLSKQRALVKYVLVKMAKSDQLSLPGYWDDLTIENIIPQTKIYDGVYTEEIIGQMGNLLLVPAKLNEKLKDKSFSEKKRILTKERYPLPQEIASEKEWTADSIMQRTEQIALNACQNIWRI
ncbi:MAG: HNH endonuclease family protein [Pseudomonadales bacterium]